MAVADIQVTLLQCRAQSPRTAPAKTVRCGSAVARAGEGWRLLADFFTAVTLALGCCRWRGHCLAECPQCVQCPH